MKRTMDSKCLILPGALCIYAGCAAMFLSGGKIYERDLAQGHSGPAYELGKCRITSNGSFVDSPVSTYHVVSADGQTGLFERSNDATGTLITNRWSDEKGDHYFVKVSDGGWEFILPKTAGAPGTRVVYAEVQTSKGPDGTLRPTSSPDARCELRYLATWGR